jgi:hypothetical protein
MVVGDGSPPPGTGKVKRSARVRFVLPRVRDTRVVARG